LGFASEIRGQQINHAPIARRRRNGHLVGKQIMDGGFPFKVTDVMEEMPDNSPIIGTMVAYRQLE
jgi:hypothetical protein